MNIPSIFHIPYDAFAYQTNERSLCIKLRTAKGDCKHIELLAGDSHHWSEGKWVHETLPMMCSNSDALYDYWKIYIQPPYRRLRYGFVLHDDTGSIFYGENGVMPHKSDSIHDYFCYPYVHVNDRYTPPSWLSETVWYQIFPDRFHNGNCANDPAHTERWKSVQPTHTSVFGGNLDGIIQKLNYLQQLGVNGLYLTPIFQSPSNHKYDTVDYFKVDPQFGDKETLQKLVSHAHRRGMKVMLDAVFNHCSRQFPLFQDALHRGEESPYYDWFHFHSEGYDTFAFEQNMPKWNTEHPDVQQYLLDVARYWVRECDIDGWRLDVANEIDHHFWRKFREVVKQENKDVYLLGEIWHQSIPWLRGDQFDGVMNYPLRELMLDFFVYEKINIEQFQHKLVTLFERYPETVQPALFNLIGSHDTARIFTLCREQTARVKLLYTFLFMTPGMPCIYYGDEIGLTGGEDPDCRRCMIWEEAGQNKKLLSHMKKLIRIRKQNSQLFAYGSWTFLLNESKLLHFVIQYNGQKVYILINPYDMFVRTNISANNVHLLLSPYTPHETGLGLLPHEAIVYTET